MTAPRSGSGTRRTLLALLGCALGAMPLKGLLSDNLWLVQGWAAMLVVLVPAALLRVRRPANALDIWPGIVLLVPWLTALYLSKHAWGGVIPNGATFTDLSHLMNSLHHTANDEVAPVHSTPAIRLVVSALLGLLAALIDLIAVVGRRGALAGVPLLIVYTVAGAVPRKPVGWQWFALAAVGYLLLLALDAEDDLRGWGRRIARTGESPRQQVLGLSAPRIGVFAVVIAVVLPFLVPSHAENLITKAFRGGSNGDSISISPTGSGGSNGIVPFAALKAQLNRDHAIPLLTVHIDGADTQPFYIRSNVLDKFDPTGFAEGGHGSTQPIAATAFPTIPGGHPTTTQFRATFTVNQLGGAPPVFTVPSTLDGVGNSAGWSAQDQILVGGQLKKGQTYAETVQQATPTIAELRAAPAADRSAMARWLQLPSMPRYVTNLVDQLTRGKITPYDRVRAISDWFADPTTGFVYSLKTTAGDSGSDLVDFLQNKTGFCQQYAAAMAVMMRLTGVPSRVVLGYMHPAPDAQGNFNITTFDAHAWVEGYFPGLGWIPFDPTPTAGLTGGKPTDLAWAPHQYGSGSASGAPTVSRSAASTARTSASSSSSTTTAIGGGAGGGGPHIPLWVPVGLVVLIALALIPAGARELRRRRRFAAARRGDPNPLWAELSDMAIDLGYRWSPARSPRQVVAWLGADAGDSAPALEALAAAVERQRYGRTGSGRTDLGPGLRAIRARLRARRSGRTRFWSTFWPASLGWGSWLRRLRPRRA